MIKNSSNTIPKITDQQRILIAPLNWGLGHATRCIPIIYELLSQGHYIIIAADGFPLQLLRTEFPELPFLDFPSFQIQYTAGKSQVGAMLKTLPRIVLGIRNEHQQLQKFIVELQISMVISDNRFGLWSKQVPSIYITHQLMIKMPKSLRLLEPLAWLMHRFIINKYTACWIPDFAEAPSLSGDLAHKYPLPQHVEFIGCLSRFSNTPDIVLSKTYDVLAVLSGPEPHRSLLENELIRTYQGKSESVLIVQGQPHKEIIQKQIENISLVSHLPTAELKAHLLSATQIICRSGYSSIMDLNVLNRKATLIPTPGQTEQEYLAELHGASTALSHLGVLFCD